MVFRLGGTPSSRGVLGFGLGREAGARAGAASVRPSGGGAAPSGTAPRRCHSSLYAGLPTLAEHQCTTARGGVSRKAHPPPATKLKERTKGSPLGKASGGPHPPGRWFPPFFYFLFYWVQAGT